MVEEPDQPATPPGDEAEPDPPLEPPSAVEADTEHAPEADTETERRRAQYREVLSQAPPLRPSQKPPKDRNEPS